MTQHDDDPFAVGPAGDPNTDAVMPGGPVGKNTVDVVKPATPTLAEGKVFNTAAGDLSVTFKGDGSFAFPWIVPKYGSVEEALVDLGEKPADVAGLNQAQKWLALFERAAKMNAHFASLGGGAAPTATPAPTSNVPAGAQSAPNNETRPCKHGAMTYKTGSKGGRTWKAFMCPTPKGAPDQCEPQWIRD